MIKLQNKIKQTEQIEALIAQSVTGVGVSALNQQLDQAGLGLSRRTLQRRLEQLVLAGRIVTTRVIALNYQS